VNRTAVFHVDGEQYVFRDREVDDLLERVGAEADSAEEAWELTKEIAKARK
jgi:hypothetical protein